jgi:hypothetical protein
LRSSLLPSGLTQLRFFFYVVCFLFGAMHVGAVIGYVLDDRDRRRVLRALTSASFGFSALPGDVWTWALYQRPVVGDFGVVSGSVVDLAAVVGLPYARLRCSIPEEMLAGNIAHVVGRAAGLSVSASAAQHDNYVALMEDMLSVRSSMSRRRSSSVSMARSSSATARVSIAVSERPPWAGDEEGDQRSAAGAAAAAAAASATSTALMFALMWVRLLLPREELAERQALAAKHFATTRTTAGNFEDLVARFKDLLVDGNMAVRSDWLAKARLWRLILLQDAAGFWDATPGLGFALQATSAAATGSVGRPVVWQAALRSMRRSMHSQLQYEPSDDEEDEAAADGEDDGADADAGDAPRAAPSSPLIAPQRRRVARCSVASCDTAINLEKVSVRDDPLHFSYDAVAASMPHALRGVTAPGAGGVRVWTTLLCVTLAESLDSCWIVNGLASKDTGEPEVTLVDLAERWLAAAAGRDAALAAALPHARAKAAQMTREWFLRQEERVGKLREHEVAAEFHLSSQLQRLTRDVVKAVQTKHETFSIFLAPSQEGVRRWQRWMLLSTGVMGAFTLEVFFYQLKARTCCTQLRQLLGCDGAHFEAPCRGFTGGCADLQAQFAAMPPSALGGVDLSTYECHAFPDQSRLGHQFWVGLAFVAVAIPIRYILSAYPPAALRACLDARP